MSAPRAGSETGSRSPRRSWRIRRALGTARPGTQLGDAQLRHHVVVILDKPSSFLFGESSSFFVSLSPSRCLAQILGCSGRATRGRGYRRRGRSGCGGCLLGDCRTNRGSQEGTSQKEAVLAARLTIGRAHSLPFDAHHRSAVSALTVSNGASRFDTSLRADASLGIRPGRSSC